MKENWLTRLMRLWSRGVTARPTLIVVVAVVLALASGVLTAYRLGFQSNRNDLISPKLEWHKRFIHWQRDFSNVFDMYVVVDAGGTDEASRDKGKAFIDDLGQKLSQNHSVLRAFYRFEQGRVNHRAIRLLPMDRFEQRLEQIAKSRTMLESPTPARLLRGTLAEMSKAGGQTTQGGATTAPTMTDEQAIADMADFRRLIDGFDAVLSIPVDQPIDLNAHVSPPDDLPTAWQYLESPNGRVFFLRVTPRLDSGELDVFGKAIAAIRADVKDSLTRHHGIEAGVTGVDVVESDETAAATWDSTWTTIVATVLILATLVVAFHSWKMPLLAIGSLLLGIGWSFGYLTLTIGHLQVLSVVFTLLLLGLGIAYGIHLASAYELLRHDYPDDNAGCIATIEECFVRMGPGIITGAVTTAAAFATTVPTDFDGVKEMGHIAAIGVGLCLVAMLSVFPAALWFFKRHHRHTVPLEDRTFHFFRESWFMPFSRHPWATLILSTIVTLAASWQMLKLKFDYDLIKLQPRGVESVVWQDRIVDQGGTSIWFAVSVADSLEEARKRADRLRALPTVDDVKGVGLLFPGDEAEKLKKIARVRESLGTLLSDNYDSTRPKETGFLAALGNTNLPTELGLVRGAMELAAKQEMPEPVRKSLLQVGASIERCLKTIGALEPAERAARLARLDKEFAAWRAGVRKQIAATLDTGPMQFTDLPSEVMSEYQSKDEKGNFTGRYTLEIFPKLPDRKPGADPEDVIVSPLDVRFLPGHLKELRTVDPEVTGITVQVYESGQMIKASYTRAGIAGFVIVFVLVWIGFGSLRYAVVSIVPVGVGFAITFAVMQLLGMAINLANIVVMPLMFGIGVDSGVHMINRYRMQPRDRPLGLTSGTGKGVTVTSLTTIISFGVMIFASHRGISDLGFVLAVGMTLTTGACWVVMPALLEVIQRHAERREAEAQTPVSSDAPPAEK